jgi:TatD DNase family protein
MEMIAHKGISIPVLMDELEQMGFDGGLDIGVSIDDVERRKSIIAPYQNIRWTAGLYPGNADKDIDDLLGRLENIIEEHHPDALGEMGLDYHWNYGTPENQKKLFIGQIELANRHNLPIVIHNRDADADMLKVLQQIPPENGHILHCYSAGSQFLDDFIQTGALISIAGNVTFKNNSSNVKEAATRVPASRLLVETDSPYLAPAPKRGRINTPNFIVYTYTEVARLRGIDVEDLAEQVRKNFSGLFSN